MIHLTFIHIFAICCALFIVTPVSAQQTNRSTSTVLIKTYDERGILVTSVSPRSFVPLEGGFAIIQAVHVLVPKGAKKGVGGAPDSYQRREVVYGVDCNSESERVVEMGSITEGRIRWHQPDGPPLPQRRFEATNFNDGTASVGTFACLAVKAPPEQHMEIADQLALGPSDATELLCDMTGGGRRWIQEIQFSDTWKLAGVKGHWTTESTVSSNRIELELYPEVEARMTIDRRLGTTTIESRRSGLVRAALASGSCRPSTEVKRRF